MTIKDIIETLQQENMDISFYVRKDGGIRITKIGTQHYRGSKGNAVARSIVGVSLSEARTRALRKLKTPKGKGSYNKRRKEPIDEETKKRIRKLQRIYKKRNYSGKPTIRGYRYNLKHYGKEEADRLLHQSDLYAEGIIYEANVQWLIDRISMIRDKVSNKYHSAIDTIIDKLNGMRTSMKYDPTYLKLIDDKGPIYELEMGRIKTEEAIQKINAILDQN